LAVKGSLDVTAAARRALGVERLVLAIHDVSFPSLADEDTGRGSPYTTGARAFLGFARDLGFDGVQLGPQGQTTLVNPSPYDGAIFSKSVLSIALRELSTDRFAGLLTEAEVDAIVSQTPAGEGVAHYQHAYRVHHEAVARAHAALRGRSDAAAEDLAARVAAFAKRSPWLRHDARFEALSAEHGTDDPRAWPAYDEAALEALEARRSDVASAFALGQYLLAEQHAAFRTHAHGLGLVLYGDLQVGISVRDAFRREALFLPGYLLGAPPSRTNPEGQPWGYPVLDPRTYHPRFTGTGPAPGRDFMNARLAAAFSDFDAVRIDHPHGLVCPWVYDARIEDPLFAVQNGTRLFGSLDREDHPELAAFAIARREQIDTGCSPWDDRRVRALDKAQVDAYATVFDLVLERARAAGRTSRDVLAEVLSTCPEPLSAVLERHGLGRFRVTQKAKPDDEADGYRSENAEPRDWIMIGSHDTEPLQRVLDRWEREGRLEARARYLASRLEPEPGRRDAFARRLAGDRRLLQTAMFADLFASPAANVMVFFADLFGERDVYNTPGVVRDENWRMRVPRDFERVYGERRAAGEAPCFFAALALAMRARGEDFVRAHADLVAALDARAAPSAAPPS
jgi:4-alpha-glucanotransferase